MMPIVMSPHIAPQSQDPFVVSLTQKRVSQTQNDAHDLRWQQLLVNIQTDVLDSEVVRRQANVWLLTHAGNLLAAENPELLLSEPLQWRFDIRLTLPDADLSHPLVTDIIGKIHCHAITGEPLINPENIKNFVHELQTHADQLINY